MVVQRVLEAPYPGSMFWCTALTGNTASFQRTKTISFQCENFTFQLCVWISHRFRLVKRCTEFNLCTSCSVVDRASAAEGNARTCLSLLTSINRDKLSYCITNEFDKNMNHLRTQRKNRFVGSTSYFRVTRKSSRPKEENLCRSSFQHDVSQKNMLLI